MRGGLGLRRVMISAGEGDVKSGGIFSQFLDGCLFNDVYVTARCCYYHRCRKAYFECCGSLRRKEKN